jgi:hypothetical protein
MSVPAGLAGRLTPQAPGRRHGGEKGLWNAYPPRRDGVLAGDYSTALFNVLGVLAALLRRDHGRGYLAPDRRYIGGAECAQYPAGTGGRRVAALSE